VINKVDLPSSRVEFVSEQIVKLLDCESEEICLISAKTGKNVDSLFKKIIDVINPPSFNPNNFKFKALIFDLLYNQYHGVIVYIRIFEGDLKKGQKIKFFSNGNVYQVDRIGVKNPKEVIKDGLSTGEIG
jgi:GTP-binding protein LepA